jgi:hypothetical protein
VALGLALKQQNAEHDGDLAVCMRLQIANVIEDVIERLIRTGRHLGARIDNPLRQ